MWRAARRTPHPPHLALRACLRVNVQAQIDQLGALVRDTYDRIGVNLADPAQLRAARATWLLIHESKDNLPWILAAIATATGDV